MLPSPDFLNDWLDSTALLAAVLFACLTLQVLGVLFLTLRQLARLGKSIPCSISGCRNQTRPVTSQASPQSESTSPKSSDSNYKSSTPFVAQKQDGVMGSEAVDVGGSPAPRCSDAALAEKIDTRETPGPAPVERCIPNTQNQNVPGCGNGATDQETFIVRGTSFPLERRWGNQAGGNNLWLEDDLPSTPSFTSTPNSGEGPRTPPTTLSVDGVWPYLSYTPAQENSGPPTPSFNSYSSSVGVDETASIKGSLTPDFIEILSSDEDDARKGSRGVTSAELHREGSAPSSNSSNLARGRQMGREIGSASKEANVASQQADNQPETLHSQAAGTSCSNQGKTSLAAPLADLLEGGTPAEFWGNFTVPRVRPRNSVTSVGFSRQQGGSVLADGTLAMKNLCISQRPCRSAEKLTKLDAGARSLPAAEHTPTSPSAVTTMTGIGAAHGRVALSPLSQSDDDGIGIVISAARRSRTKSRAALVLESSDEEDPYELQNTAPPGTLITGQTPGAKAREGIVPWVTPGGSARAKNREPFGLLSNLHGSKAAPTPRPSVTPAAFRKRRDGMAREFFKEFNEKIFSNALPGDTEITWSANLSTTAGVTHYNRKLSDPNDFLSPAVYSARVDLSSKVLDTEERLRSTLCHELCHVAAWVLDHTAKPPHGKVFKKWAAIAMRNYPSLKVTTCHQYKIHYPFRWRCTNSACGEEYGRHSNSIDITHQVCGACKSKLESLGRFKADGTPAPKRKASAFSLFVAVNFAATKAELGAAATQADVMRVLSDKWRDKDHTNTGTHPREAPQPIAPSSVIVLD